MGRGTSGLRIGTALTLTALLACPAAAAPKPAPPRAERADGRPVESRSGKSHDARGRVEKSRGIEGLKPAAVKDAAKPTPAGQAAEPPVVEAGPPALSCAFPRGVCGFVGGDGRVVIHPGFDWAEPFERGLARVKVAGRYGVIDLFGRFVVPAQWDHVSRFERGVAMVVAAGRHGAVGRDGGEVLPARYAAAFRISDDVFLVDVGPHDAAADPGRFEHEEERPPPARALPGRWGVAEGADRWLLSPRFREVRAFDDGAPAGSFWARPAHKWQMVSARGAPLTGAVYDQVDTAVGGVAVVRVGNQWNAVDAEGRTLLPADAAAVRRRPDGLVSYQSGDRVGLIGGDGAVAVPPEFDRIGVFVGGRAPALRAGVDIWIDGRGRPVDGAVDPPKAAPTATAKPPRAPKGRVMACPDGLTLKAGAGGWSFVDRKWHPAIEGVFEAARCFVRGTALVVRPGSGQWTRIDRNGAPVDGPSFCRLPDYAADSAGTVGRQPACRPAETAETAAAQRRVVGGGP